jgi:hypothetical protein
MPIIVTIAVIVLAAFVSTSTGSADAFIAVLFVGPFAAVGLFYAVLLVRLMLRFIFVGSHKS